MCVMCIYGELEYTHCLQLHHCKLKTQINYNSFPTCTKVSQILRFILSLLHQKSDVGQLVEGMRKKREKILVNSFFQSGKAKICQLMIRESATACFSFHFTFSKAMDYKTNTKSTHTRTYVHISKHL